MELTRAIHQTFNEDTPGTRLLRAARGTRKTRDMASLIASAIAGAAATGVAATLVMMSTPAHADPYRVQLNTLETARTPLSISSNAQVQAARASVNGKPVSLNTFTAGLPSLPPVCTCALPPSDTD